MTQNKNNSIHTTRLYLILILVSIVVMSIAAFITYGNDAKEVHVSLGSDEEVVENKPESDNKIGIGGTDLSKVPSDDDVEDILNDEIPDVCEYCNADKPLDCLEEYKVNKILVQDPAHQNHLFIELITGDEKYVVVIDLENNNKVLNSEGEIDEDVCLSTETEILVGSGEDPKDSEYATAKPKE